jgi:hypothetical protein
LVAALLLDDNIALVLSSQFVEHFWVIDIGGGKGQTQAITGQASVKTQLGQRQATYRGRNCFGPPQKRNFDSMIWRNLQMNLRSWIALSLRTCAVAAALVWLAESRATAQTATFDFEGGNDQGFGTGFGNDASASFPIVNIGGSNRMEVLDTASFQQAGRETSNPADPWYIALSAASVDETLATFSYDWYIDTSLAPGAYGTFLQLGTYFNTGNGYYAQDFPGAGKEVELNGAQLASGQVFSGTVSFTLASKGFDLPLAQTFFRPGFISNGDGTQAKIYFDNVTLTVIPEPASFAMLGLGMLGLALVRARRGTN